MTTSSLNIATQRNDRWHPFGAHGVLLALPISLALWALIAVPFI